MSFNIDMALKQRASKTLENEMKSKKSYTKIFLKGMVWLNAMTIALILGSMFLNVSVESMQHIMTMELLSAVSISFASVIISMAFVIIIGIPIAFVLATKKDKKYKYMEGIICLPMVLPPTVAGLALLMTFGRNGLVGGFLNSLGIAIPFTILAVIITQIFIVSPFFIQIVKNEFQTIDPKIIEAAKVCGATDAQLITKIYMPIAKRSIFTGLILCVLRALGEFGATIMFAGNMVGRTQTLTLRIYSLYQIDIMQGVSLAVIQLIMILLVFFALKHTTNKWIHKR
ncbi:molybdate transport system permease protein [Natranaerovirga hydrolytica]|uniref:Molybdate transport system permease protein n=1 Tax=Natranaerovirga hydrolytica TaxID=680378 RepID=A0A4R1MJF0_9FIRM|nr:ABC transporter permease subunit [Natranaerovirga hydrolytica]TCK92908.1 molybdate transport system permease protein [Natranaerovirga hydrolytica]